MLQGIQSAAPPCVLGDRCCAAVPASHFAAKNSPPDCFHRQSRPTLFESLYLFLPMSEAGLATCFSFWRRARDFFGALPCTFASLRSLTTSAKTVHRTVFFRRQVCSLLVRIPFIYFCQCKKQALKPAVFSFLLGLKPRFLCRPGI